MPPMRSQGRHQSPVSMRSALTACTASSMRAMLPAAITPLSALPTWPHSRNWGYGPSGGLGLIVIIIVVLLLMGRI